MTDLKPCPFCGCDAWMHTHGSVFSGGSAGHRIECEGTCHAMTCYWHSKEEAITAWNTRTPDTDWQPIETAPKEGTFLVCDATHAHSEDIPGSIQVVWMEEDSFFVDFYIVDGEFYYLEYAETPTHWKPLDTPPNSG